MEIREYQKEDKTACMGGFKTNVPKFFTQSEVDDFSAFLDRYLTQEPNEKGLKSTYYYVIVLDGKVIGSGGFGFYNGAAEISLAWGFVHKDFHKKGYGEKLLVYRMEQIKKLFPSQTLVIDTTQHSYTFFEKYGFVTTKITPDFYTNGMHRYDMVLKN